MEIENCNKVMIEPGSKLPLIEEAKNLPKLEDAQKDVIYRDVNNNLWVVTNDGWQQINKDKNSHVPATITGSNGIKVEILGEDEQKFDIDGQDILSKINEKIHESEKQNKIKYISSGNVGDDSNMIYFAVSENEQMDLENGIVLMTSPKNDVAGLYIAPGLKNNLVMLSDSVYIENLNHSESVTLSLGNELKLVKDSVKSANNINSKMPLVMETEKGFMLKFWENDYLNLNPDENGKILAPESTKTLFKKFLDINTNTTKAHVFNVTKGSATAQVIESIDKIAIRLSPTVDWNKFPTENGMIKIIDVLSSEFGDMKNFSALVGTETGTLTAYYKQAVTGSVKTMPINYIWVNGEGLYFINSSQIDGTVYFQETQMFDIYKTL